MNISGVEIVRRELRGLVKEVDQREKIAVWQLTELTPEIIEFTDVGILGEAAAQERMYRSRRICV